ncbi:MULTISPECIES: hypothetical protein [unclassified Novosphingobium]|uniref:hypothetical protein n=1 Tax=unclassified Novosphingobium TaxID=2644732 RepID=UPI001AC11974|nr:MULTISPECIES: hypothetical protein [unclassified Novosphingobium]MBN9146516.1 hypothetical protein [Novosphingobium sp.]MDR6710293.1 hypothetical protein [Novosphingobium sp. 1748]
MKSILFTASLFLTGCSVGSSPSKDSWWSSPKSHEGFTELGRGCYNEVSDKNIKLALRSLEKSKFVEVDYQKFIGPSYKWVNCNFSHAYLIRFLRYEISDEPFFVYERGQDILAVHGILSHSQPMPIHSALVVLTHQPVTNSYTYVESDE